MKEQQLVQLPPIEADLVPLLSALITHVYTHKRAASLQNPTAPAVHQANRLEKLDRWATAAQGFSP